jgi:P27 family predicted phage terminase small subunit
MAGYYGKQGRKPKASTLAEWQRTKSIDRNIPGPPSHLSEEGKACWRELVKTLQNAGLIARADADALALYCTAYERWLVAEKGIRKHGLLVKTPNGFPTISPLLSVANKAMDQMMRLLSEFGMTPASRYRLPTETEPRSRFNPSTHLDDEEDPRKYLEECQK